MKVSVYSFTLALLFSVSAANHLAGRPVKAQLDHVFSQFIKANDFQGAQLGVMQGSRLIYAEAQGSFHGKPASTQDLVPTLDLSKTVTAVAILQLVEQGYFTLDTKVFGFEGILYYLEPRNTDTVDPRVYDITIEHLLRHSAGWDETAHPTLDPMKNQALLALGFDVPDMAQDLGRDDGMLDQYDIIQYMVGQPLQFAPGERYAHSNFGYSVLGRIVESVMGETYESYIKDNILEPAGMWHTKIGSSRSNNDRQKVVLKAKGKTFNSGAYNLITPQVLDSTLGLYSNVYDIARFFAALYGGSGNPILLRPATLQYALQRNPEIARHETSHCSSLGLTVQDDGALTLKANDDNLGVSVLYYKEAMTGPFGDDELDSYLRGSNTALVFIGFTNNRMSHMDGLHDSILSLDVNLLNQNAYIRDLCDIELATEHSQVLTKHRLDEHRLVSYSNAMRLAGYHPTWLHSYSYHGHTYFMSIFELATDPIQLQFKLKKSASLSKMYRFISNNAKEGYQVSLLQTLRSASHNDHIVYFVLVRRTSEPAVTMFNFNTNLQTYQTELPYHMAEGYQQQVQGILTSAQGPPKVSFVLQKPGPCSSPVATQAFTNITLEELHNKQTLLQSEGFSLTYIDTYTDNQETRFSVIFKQKDIDSMIQLGVTADTFITEAFDKTNEGFLPNLAVAYQDNDELRYMVQWVRIL